MKIKYNTSGDHLVDQKEKEMSTRQQLVEEDLQGLFLLEGEDEG
jgi:hypothetical protein